jgi:Protein of unknown function (DUF1016).
MRRETSKTSGVRLGKEASFVVALKQIVQSARTRAYAAINYAQVEANWLIGRQIVEQEQHGNAQAEYGKRIIHFASEELTKEFGRGVSEWNLWKFKQFYLLFEKFQILPTLSTESKNSYSHALARHRNYTARRTQNKRKGVKTQKARVRVCFKIFAPSRLRVKKNVPLRETLNTGSKRAPKKSMRLLGNECVDSANTVRQIVEQLFASKYKLLLPTEDELRREIERQKELFQIHASQGSGLLAERKTSHARKLHD